MSLFRDAVYEHCRPRQSAERTLTHESISSELVRNVCLLSLTIKAAFSESLIKSTRLVVVA